MEREIRIKINLCDEFTFEIDWKAVIGIAVAVVGVMFFR